MRLRYVAPKPVGRLINARQGSLLRSRRPARTSRDRFRVAVARALGAAGHALGLDQRLAARFARPVAVRAFADRRVPPPPRPGPRARAGGSLRRLGPGRQILKPPASPPRARRPAGRRRPFSAMFDAHLRERLA
ncbi:hypothetical protein ACRAWD_02305 [Caulobacter segnis]